MRNLMTKEEVRKIALKKASKAILNAINSSDVRFEFEEAAHISHHLHQLYVLIDDTDEAKDLLSMAVDISINPYVSDTQITATFKAATFAVDRHRLDISTGTTILLDAKDVDMATILAHVKRHLCDHYVTKLYVHVIGEGEAYREALTDYCPDVAVFGK